MGSFRGSGNMENMRRRQFYGVDSGAWRRADSSIHTEFYTGRGVAWYGYVQSTGRVGVPLIRNFVCGNLY